MKLKKTKTIPKRKKGWSWTALIAVQEKFLRLLASGDDGMFVLIFENILYFSLKSVLLSCCDCLKSDRGFHDESSIVSMMELVKNSHAAKDQWLMWIIKVDFKKSLRAVNKDMKWKIVMLSLVSDLENFLVNLNGSK